MMIGDIIVVVLCIIYIIFGVGTLGFIAMEAYWTCRTIVKGFKRKRK